MGGDVAAVRGWPGREGAGSRQSDLSSPTLPLTQAKREVEARKPHCHDTAPGGKDRCDFHPPALKEHPVREYVTQVTSNHNMVTRYGRGHTGCKGGSPDLD